MNYEDRGIDEYYKRKDEEHEEMVGCGCKLIVVLLIVGFVICMAILIRGLLQ